MLKVTNYFAAALVLAIGLILAIPAGAQDLDAASILKVQTWSTTDGSKIEGVALRVLKDEVVVLNTKEHTQHRIKRSELGKELAAHVQLMEDQINQLRQPLALAGKTRGVQFDEASLPKSAEAPATTATYQLRNGKKNGRYVEVASNGSLFWAGLMVHGQPEGPLLQFWPIGELYHQLIARGGKVHAMMTFYRDGTIATYLPYENDAVSGATAVFYPSGRLHRLTHYEAGQANGTDTLFLPTGEELTEATLRSGQQVGKKTLRKHTELESIEMNELVEQASPKTFLGKWDAALAK